jgi:hypothetical protein
VVTLVTLQAVLELFALIIDLQDWILKHASVGFFIGAPSMARSALLVLFRYASWRSDDLVVKVHYRPGKGND